ncbi:MAG: EamA family transporter [Clostridiales Family XIII bacterium]|jgi:drug/metabolite transporter (DMT)-like permease|nr:EamA family transporter [Clostridiales Family XIII bacterium]
MWILLLIVHLIGNTGYNIELRRAAFKDKVDSLFLVAIMATSIAIPAVPGIIITGFDFSFFNVKTSVLYAGAIIVTLSFHLFNVKALEYTEASFYTFLYNLRICFTTVLGIVFLREEIVPLRILGGGIVLVSAILLIGKVRTGAKGIIYSILAGAFVSLTNLFDKYLITQMGYTDYIFSTSIMIAVVIWVIVIARGLKNVDWSVLKTKANASLMFTRCISAYGFTASLAAGGILSTATYISSLSFITTMICAVIFLKERDSLKRKTIAAAIALVGVTLIYIASI